MVLGYENLTDYYFFKPGLLGRKPCVIEIGAYSYMAFDAFFVRYPLCSYIIYEPCPSNYANLLRLYGSHSIKVNAALSDKDGIVDLFEYPNPDSHSLFPAHELEGKKLIKVHSVQGLTLNTMVSVSGFKSIDLLLMNCEGAEIFALREIVENDELRRKIKQVCVGYHCEHRKLYSPDVRDDIDRQLSLTHESSLWRHDKLVYVLYILR